MVLGLQSIVDGSYSTWSWAGGARINRLNFIPDRQVDWGIQGNSYDGKGQPGPMTCKRKENCLKIEDIQDSYKVDMSFDVIMLCYLNC